MASPTRAKGQTRTILVLVELPRPIRPAARARRSRRPGPQTRRTTPMAKAKKKLPPRKVARKAAAPKKALPKKARPAASSAAVDPNLLGDLMKWAKAAGADSADALYVHGESISVAQRLGAREKLESSEGRDLGLRVFIGKRQAFVS